MIVNRVALVTGGSRGVGRGIVIGLCEDGWTVYYTGRNVTDLEKTKEHCSEFIGRPIPVQFDHSKQDPADLFSRIAGETGKLHLLVNNVWSGYDGMLVNGKFTWLDKFWDQTEERWDSIFNVGVKSVFMHSKLAVKLIGQQQRGLIINISYWAAQKYMANVIYGAAKAVVNKLTEDMAQELKDTPITVSTLYPGLVRTESVLQYAEHFDLSNSESPQFIGRVVAAMWNDIHLKEKSGQVVVAAGLAAQYGVIDIDGKRPRPLNAETAL